MLTVFFFVFVERCFSCLVGCIERCTWLAVFDENTRFSGHGVFFLLDPAKTLVSLVLLLSGRQRWTSAEHVDLRLKCARLEFSGCRVRAPAAPGKPTGSVVKETIAVSVTMSISVQK